MSADVYALDCITGLSLLPAGCAALVFLDLPYGVTANVWDKRVPIEPLWRELKRVGRSTCVYVFTAVQPFTSLVVCSNLEWFRYERIWCKNKVTGHLNAKRRPMRKHENVLVFFGEEPEYVPQMTTGHEPMHAATRRCRSTNYRAQMKVTQSDAGTTQRYPTTILDIPIVNNDDPSRIHPNQKPEALISEFILTYTKPGDLVIDPTCGSGATLKAAKRLDRSSIGFDTDVAMIERVRQDLEVAAGGGRPSSPSLGGGAAGSDSAMPDAERGGSE